VPLFWFVDLVDAGDLEAVALCGELEEGVQRVRAIGAGRDVEAHGKAAPVGVLAASGSAMWRRESARPELA
jgi:hypothetical protein